MFCLKPQPRRPGCKVFLEFLVLFSQFKLKFEKRNIKKNGKHFTKCFELYICPMVGKHLITPVCLKSQSHQT